MIIENYLEISREKKEIFKLINFILIVVSHLHYKVEIT